MATLVLSTVGRVAGGPLGAIVGGSLGNIVDRLAGGADAPREIGRIADLSVQSSAYGAALPIIHGRMRVAGNIIWSNGIDESRARSRGKGRSRATVFSYTSSFAVAIAARPITGIGRIWADGRLLRDADGAFITPVTWRLHAGSEDQPPDPLIMAAEGIAPAYRGTAYAVFEDLPLADWGNRIPNLSFEVIADTDAVDAGRIIADLAAADGVPTLTPSGGFPRLAGHAAADAGSRRGLIAPLLALTGAVGDGVAAVIGSRATATRLPAGDSDAQRPGAGLAAEQRREAGLAAGAAELIFHDPARDYQAGLQRVRRPGADAGTIERQALNAALSADVAKALAADMLARRAAARVTATVRLPWRYLGIMPGDHLCLPGDGARYRVMTRRFANFVVALDLERVGGAGLGAAVPADAGRPARFADRAAGPTSVRVLDLPPLPGDLPVAPRLWVAGAGADPGWRTAPVIASVDAGASFSLVGDLVGGTIIGTALTSLPAGPVAAWDSAASVDVAVLAETMWLESASDAAVLAGANLALIGNELVQFASVEALAPGRFRLSRLLRGRRGSEAAVAGHAAGERFVLLDPATMLPLDPDVGAVGQAVLVRADGAGDIDTPAVAAVIGGAALRPLSPVHVRVAAVGDDRLVTWVRRSRAGFGWADFVDAPLAEAREAYRLTLRRNGSVLRLIEVTEPRWIYDAAARAADGPAMIALAIAQLSDAVGPGTPTTISL